MAEQPDNNGDTRTRRRLTPEDMKRREQTIAAIRNRDNLIAAKKQVDKVIGDLQTNFLARYPWGYGRGEIATRATQKVAANRVHAGRDLSDPEARAVTETSRAEVSAVGLTQWVSGAFALYFWNKGRATGKLPFPMHFIRLQSPSPVNHAMRLLAYWAVVNFASTPLRLIAGLTAEQLAVKERAPVLGQLMAECRQRTAKGVVENQNMVQSAGQLWDKVLEQKHDDQPSEADSASYPSSYESSAQTTTEPTYEAPAISAQRQQTSSSWGSSDLDIDDGSPVAPEASQSSNTWARVRQQSHAGQAQRGSQTSNAWQRQRQQAQASEQWDSAGAGRSPEARGAHESVSFGSADPERDSAREQAQREFDAMLERERQGSDAGGNTRPGRGPRW